eukprot:TRINITY_DN2680_c0_g1_i2.p2 TRINITY_DN2680_c0_g1~~TRINITY_DN2680_c0_g1_i2.p2  ORF type:complete len:263 (+),score=28.71 TRINITY_DN2680_c0_g1_i2:110-790(+)
MRVRWLLLFFALLSHSRCQDVVADEYDDEYEEIPEEDTAFLIVHKYVKEESIVVGRNLTFVLNIYNAGSASAKQVQVMDYLAQEENFTLIDGELEFTVASISPQKKYEHQYVVIPSLGGYMFQAPTASVRYQANPDEPSAAHKTSFSTPVKFVVMTPTQRFQQYLLQVGSYLTFGHFRTLEEWKRLAMILGVAVGVPGLFFGYNWLVEKNKDARRQRAYRDLTKDE